MIGLQNFKERTTYCIHLQMARSSGSLAKSSRYLGRPNTQHDLLTEVVLDAQLQGSTAIIEASDGGQVTITLNPVGPLSLKERAAHFADLALQDSHFSDEYVEVLGRVQKDNVVMELASSNLGENYGASPSLS